MVDREFGLPFLVGSSLVVKGESGLAFLVDCCNIVVQISAD